VGKSGLYVLKFENLPHAKARRREGKKSNCIFEPEAIQGILMGFTACLRDTDRQAANPYRRYFICVYPQIAFFASLRLRVRNARLDNPLDLVKHD
jgi:hypothetical protein